MSGVTQGEWKYRPGKGRHVTNEEGESVCTMHRGKKAQWNGPVVAAAKDCYRSTYVLLETVRELVDGKEIPDLYERIDYAEVAIAKANGETDVGQGKTGIESDCVGGVVEERCASGGKG